MVNHQSSCELSPDFIVHTDTKDTSMAGNVKKNKAELIQYQQNLFECVTVNARN